MPWLFWRKDRQENLINTRADESQNDQRNLKYSFHTSKTPNSVISGGIKGTPYLFPQFSQQKSLLFQSAQKKQFFSQKVKAEKIENQKSSCQATQSPRISQNSPFIARKIILKLPKRCEKSIVISQFSTIQNSTASQEPLIIQRNRVSQLPPQKTQTKCKVSLQSFKIIKTLGKGKFGDVFLGIHKLSGLVLALKKIEKEKVRKFNMVKQVRDEINIHTNLNHPNIVKLYGVFEEEESIFLIMECVVGETLFEHLNQKERLSIKETKKYMEGVIQAIHYMHDKSIAHRDIKPENILITDSGVAKVCDMGWSAVMTTSRKTYCGTFDYVAPQILERKDYGLSVDIWCLGILVYELLFGKMPFEGDKRTVICKKLSNAELQFPADFPNEGKDFICWLMRKNPQERPKCRQLLGHKFFNSPIF